MEETPDQGRQSLHPTQVRHGHGSQGFRLSPGEYGDR